MNPGNNTRQAVPGPSGSSTPSAPGASSLFRFLPRGKFVVLRLVTSKRPQFESKGDLERRIVEASRYSPLEPLCLSPQCGFSSTVEGNAHEQRPKLALVVEAAEDVWG